jgi:hypothetical protein
MSLLVHYQNLKHFDADKNQWLGEKGQNAIDQKQQADTLGWLMMAIGVNEITEKTIDEMIFRTRFLDFVWGKPYFTQDPSTTDLRQLFKNHIGLRIVITNRGMNNISTRHKFMVAQLNSIEERIMKQINN